MRKPVAIAVAATFCAAAPAAALPLPGTNLEVNANATLMSDYRFRGVSRSDEDPALQGQLTLTHGSGFYTGARATTLDGLDGFRLRDPDFEELGDLQLDLYAGYSADIGRGFTLDGGLMYYAFTGAEGETNYFEPYASASYLIGPLEATVGAKYAPAQDAIGGEDQLYLFGEAVAGIPFTPLSFTAHAGRQDWGRYGSYWNWSVGARTTFGPVSAGVRYVDTGLPDFAPIPGQPRVDGVDAGVVVSLGVGF